MRVLLNTEIDVRVLLSTESGVTVLLSKDWCESITQY